MVSHIRDRLGRRMGYWVHAPALGLLNNAIHHSRKLVSIDACSAFGAFSRQHLDQWYFVIDFEFEDKRASTEVGRATERH